MVVWRRTLYCLPCTRAEPELARITMQVDESVVAHRVYADLSGPTDRVITEMERETLVHPREFSRRFLGNAEAARLIGEMVGLVDHAEVEFLSLEVYQRRSEA